jgi:penicillin-binding protein 1C
MAANAKLPPPLQRFRQDTLLRGEASASPRILFPPNGARIELTRTNGETEPVPLKIAGGRGPLTVLVNGVPLATDGGKRTLFFAPDGPGFLRVTVTDRKGSADSVTVRVQ